MGGAQHPAVFIGIAATVLESIFIFAPIVNRIFGSSPIALGDAGLAILVGASILPVNSVEKWWRNRGLKNP